MRCPHCADDSLREKPIRDEGVRLDVCDRCQGVWYDGGELQRLMTVAAGELHVLDASAPSERLCPRCLRRMFVFNFPRTVVTVDMCGHCRGLWLDASESKEIKTVRDQQQRQQAAAGGTSPTRVTTGITDDLLQLIDRITDRL